MVPTTFHIYRPGQSDRETRTVGMPENPGYKDLCAVIEPLLDGKRLEHVAVLHEKRRADMFVDGTGAIDRLPRNEAATAIYRNNWLTQHPEVDPESIPAIYGVAVLFDRIVWS